MMSIIASLISVASLAFSIYVFFQNRSSKKNKRKYDTLTPIYMDYLLEKIPLSFSKLNFKVADNSGVNEFISIIQETIIKIKVIQILDNKTYAEWSKQLMEIEDFVTNKANKVAPDDDHNQKIISDLSNMLHKLYETMLSESFKSMLN